MSRLLQSYQNTRGGQGVKDWRKFQKARLNSTIGIVQSHFHFTTWKAYGHWVIIEGVDNQQQRNTVGQWGRLYISIWSRLCWHRVTRQPRKDVKKEGKKNHADRAQDQGPPQCRYQHNFNDLYRCLQNYKSSYRHESSKSPAKDKSAPKAEEGRTRASLPRLSSLAHLQQQKVNKSLELSTSSDGLLPAGIIYIICATWLYYFFT